MDQELKDIVPGDEVNMRRLQYEANKAIGEAAASDTRKDYETKETVQKARYIVSGNSADVLDHVATAVEMNLALNEIQRGDPKPFFKRMIDFDYRFDVIASVIAAVALLGLAAYVSIKYFW